MIVVLYAFNDSVAQAWPIEQFTTKWFADRLATTRRCARRSPTRSRWRRSPRCSRSCSGSAAAFAVHRFRFFGRNAVSFLLVLPIALPGIVTAIALQHDDQQLPDPVRRARRSSIGHATFCIVVVYNNVLARLRRTPTSLDRGVDGPGRRRLADVPLRHVPGDPDGARRGRAARVRALVRRDRRDELHRGDARSRSRSSSTTTSRLPRNRPVVNVVAVAVILRDVDPRLHRAADGRRWGRDRDRREGGGGGGLTRSLEVLAPGLVRRRAPAGVGAPGEPAAPELLELRARGHLLREQRGLDPVEQALEPSDELGLRDADLGVGGHALHRRRERGELLLQVGRQHVLELADRALVDLTEPDAPGLVERRLARVLEQLADHARDPQQLRGLGDRFVLGLLAALRLARRDAGPAPEAGRGSGPHPSRRD